MFDGKLDVHGRQDREDVGLQEGYEDLEAGHHEHGGTGQRGGGRQDGEFVEQNCRPERRSCRAADVRRSCCTGVAASV